VTKIPDMDGTGPRWYLQKNNACHGRVNFSDSKSLNEDLVNLTETVKTTGTEGFYHRCRRRIGRSV